MGELLSSLRDHRQGRWAQVYLRGLLLEGRRKSVQPIAERLPDGDEQGLQQFLNQSPWEWEPVRAAIAKKMSAALGEEGCWIVDDTGFPKQGRHSVGVARQYSGTLGKRGNCQVGVSLSYATPQGAMPLAWALYLPKEWTDDSARCERVGVPAEVQFQTKWQLALGLIDDVLSWGVDAPEVMVVDAGYGSITEFRQGLAVRQLRYVAEVEHTLVAWTQPQRREAPVRRKSHAGRPRVPKYRETPAPESLKAITLRLPRSAWRKVTWREGTKGTMSFSLCPPAGAAGPRLATRERGTAVGVAADRVASRTESAHQVLALGPARRHPDAHPGAMGEEPLGGGDELSGDEGSSWTGSF